MVGCNNGVPKWQLRIKYCGEHRKQSDRAYAHRRLNGAKEYRKRLPLTN